MDFFKKYFIPHKRNDYKPHLFRRAGIVGLLSLTFIIFAAAVSGPIILKVTDMTALVLPRVLIDYANQDRLAANFPGLTISPVLQKAAQMKADDMATKGYFAHKSPDGHTPWYWFTKAGYDFNYAGENLAVNFTDSVDVNTAWMNSSSHRENIMNGNFTEIGIATADGTYQGRPTTFVVQLFGTPARETVVPTPSKISKAGTKVVIPKPESKINPILPTIISSSVLGASNASDLYIAVENKSAVRATTSSPRAEYSNWLEKVLLSPKKLLSFSYLVIVLIIVIGLLLTILIEIKKQHPYLIASALFVLLIICVLLYVYESLLFAPLLII